MEGGKHEMIEVGDTIHNSTGKSVIVTDIERYKGGLVVTGTLPSGAAFGLGVVEAPVPEFKLYDWRSYAALTRITLPNGIAVACVTTRLDGVARTLANCNAAIRKALDQLEVEARESLRQAIED